MLSLTEESISHVSIEKGPLNTIENRVLPSKTSIYFFVFTLCTVIFASTAWVIVYRLQKYRLNNLKANLKVKFLKNIYTSEIFRISGCMYGSAGKGFLIS